MRAERAVEPTKSENITVTWRRSARCCTPRRGLVAASSLRGFLRGSQRLCALGGAALLPQIPSQRRGWHSAPIATSLFAGGAFISKWLAIFPSHSIGTRPGKAVACAKLGTKSSFLWPPAARNDSKSYRIAQSGLRVITTKSGCNYGSNKPQGCQLCRLSQPEISLITGIAGN